MAGPSHSSGVRSRGQTGGESLPQKNAGAGGTKRFSKNKKLAMSVMIDLIGMSSFIFPGIGEVADIGWAPVSSALIMYLHGNGMLAGLGFVEEILPGFDIIPTATLAWFMTSSKTGERVTKRVTR